MPLDPSLFIQGAALRQKNNEQLLQSIQNAQENSIKRDTIEADKAKTGLDLDKLFTPVAIKMSMGAQLSPEEQGIAKAYDMVNTSKLGQDASGNYRRVNASIFNGGNTLPVVEGNTPGIPSGNIDLSAIPPLSADNVTDTKIGLDPSIFGVKPPPPSIEGVPMPNKDAADAVETGPSAIYRAQSLYAGNPNAQQKYIESDAGKRGEADAAEDKTVRGKVDFDKALQDLSAANDKLKAIGGTQSEGRDVLGNVKSYLGSTDVGQEVGNATASPAQTIRQQMMTTRGALARKIMAATGMSAKQMDSNAELKQFMDTLGNPQASYEARKAAYTSLSKLYGNDVFKSSVDYKSKYGLQ